MRRVLTALALLLLASCAPVTAPLAPERSTPTLAARLPIDPTSSGPPPSLMHVRGHVVGDALVIQAELAPDSPIPLTNDRWVFKFWLDVDQNPRTPGHHELVRDTTLCDYGSEFVLAHQSPHVNYGVPGAFTISYISVDDCSYGPPAGLGRVEIAGRTIRWAFPLDVLADDGAATVRLELGVMGSRVRWGWHLFDTRGRHGAGRTLE